MLIKSVSLEGNLVLNFGHDGNRSIKSEKIIIEDWMKVKNKAVYLILTHES